MKGKLEKRIALMLAGGAFALGAAGCGTTSHTYNRTVSDREQPRYESSALTTTAIRVPKPSGRNVREKAQMLIDYADFCQKYEGMTKSIESDLKNKRYSSADKKVQNLAEKLRYDKNPYAQLQRKRLIDFKYAIIEVNERVRKTAGRKTNFKLWDTVLGLPVRLSFAAIEESINIITFNNDLGEGVEGVIDHYVPRVDDEDVIGRTYDLLEVTPYNARKRKLLDDVSRHKLIEFIKKRYGK